MESFLAPADRAQGAALGFFARSGGYRGAQGASSGGAVPMEVSNINMQADPFAADGGFDEPDGYAEAQLLSRIYELEQAQQQQQQQFVAMLQRSGGSSGIRSRCFPGASHRRASRRKGPLVPGISKADYERCRKEEPLPQVQAAGPQRRGLRQARVVKLVGPAEKIPTIESLL